jgi:hypothetical protein
MQEEVQVRDTAAVSLAICAPATHPASPPLAAAQTSLSPVREGVLGKQHPHLG